jgi:hypothetical protein
MNNYLYKHTRVDKTQTTATLSMLTHNVAHLGSFPLFFMKGDGDDIWGAEDAARGDERELEGDHHYDSRDDSMIPVRCLFFCCCNNS